MQRNLKFRAAWRIAEFKCGLAGYDGGTTTTVSRHQHPGLMTRNGRPEVWSIDTAATSEPDKHSQGNVEQPRYCKCVTNYNSVPDPLQLSIGMSQYALQPRVGHGYDLCQIVGETILDDA